MTNWVAPLYSSSRIKTAGKRLRDETASLDDVLALENWRASHAYVLNIFQTNLRNRARGRDVTVAQRLKRRPTILDKLKREPTMQLNTMHDIAGCRLIFDNQSSLLEFRSKLREGRSSHIIKYREEDRYNYLDRPKPSGYRGIHDVYEYKVVNSTGEKWNGLHVEIQSRTIYQHAWATAVEAADLVTSSRIKFSRAEQEYEDFFRFCSEIIARVFEGSRSCLQNLSDTDIVNGFRHLENQTGLLVTLRNLKKSSSSLRLKTNSILIFRTTAKDDESPLKIETFETVNKAVERYNHLEKEMSGVADIVLVRAENADNIRDAFRNYFSDVHDFLSYMDFGLARLQTP